MDLRRKQTPKAQTNNNLDVQYKTIFHLRLILVPIGASVNISVGPISNSFCNCDSSLFLYINLLVSTVVTTRIYI